MATVSDLTVTPLSGLNHIDALLDSGPDWNYLTPAGNTIRYTFSVASGNEAGQGGQQAFSAAQQTGARAAMAVLSAATGIIFEETANGGAASVHLCSVDIAQNNVTGLCSWSSSYNYQGSTVTSYSAQAYVYLDNAEFAAENANLTAGSGGFQTLLHELGHMIGLKHPFEGSINLPVGENNTSYTLLSYTSQGGPYSVFSPYDIAALNWLYGGDGLGGALGINSTGGGRYFTGTSLADSLSGTAANDRLEGDGGDDSLNGGAGIDTAVFRGNYASYTVTDLGGGNLRVTGADGDDTLTSVEILKFDDQSVQHAQTDTTAPGAPTIVIARNANGYVSGDKPVVSGTAEANAKVELFSGATLIATTTASASGAYSVTAPAFADGTGYSVTARATDLASNVSPASAAIAFNVDAHAPAAPTAAVSLPAAGGVVFSGTGEAASTIRLTNANAIIASTTVDANGNWSVSGNALGNGSYDVSVTSLDKADNATTATTHLLFALGAVTPVTGTAGNDTLQPTTGNNTIDGGAGTDTVSYGGVRGNYDVVRDSAGFVVTARSGSDGTDLLRNVESIKFSDATVKLEYDDVVQALYVAYFGRAADFTGLSNFQGQLGSLKAPLNFSGLAAAYATDGALHSLIDSFGTSAESAALYPNATGSFVTAVFQNVFGRAPAAGGLAFWTDAIDNGSLSKANASLSIMAGALANSSAQGLLDAKLVNNKIVIASDFTLAIDTAAEIAGYAGKAAAATVRGMLGSVTASTDIAAFQATIQATLEGLSGAGAQGATASLESAALQSVPLAVQHIALVGVPGGWIDAPL